MQVEERPDPAPGGEEVLVTVSFGAGLNPADLVQRGLYRLRPGVLRTSQASRLRAS